MSAKIEKIKRDILSRLKEINKSEEDLYGSPLWTIIKTRNKYTTINDITEESELQSLYDILDNYGSDVDYINSKLEPTDSIRDIFNKIKDYVDTEADAEAEAFVEEEDRKEARATAAPLTQDSVEIVPFDASIHCGSDENCNEVDITGILTPEEKNNKDMFTQSGFIYEPGRGLYQPEGSVSDNPNNLRLVTKFNERLLDAIAGMPTSEYEIQRIKYRIQKTNNKEFNQGLYLHREKRDLISFWVFQNINCSNAGTVIAKRVGDKAHITKIPDDRAFVVNDSIYAHKAPLDWVVSSPEFTRSILVAEIELNPRSYNKGREVVSHDLSSILVPANRGLTIGGLIRRRKTKKTNKRKTKKTKKTNKRKTKKSRK
jgi:hypothetical protein